jgi:hypothetical protein
LRGAAYRVLNSICVIELVYKKKRATEAVQLLVRDLKKMKI